MQTQELYNNIMDRWNKSDATFEGMLGSFPEMHDDDIRESEILLKWLIDGQYVNLGSVLEPCAGIGRVTSCLLQRYFEEIDIFDQERRFVEAAKINLRDIEAVQKIEHCSIQNYNFDKKYDVIWTQWCFDILGDEDLFAFLKKCKENLKQDGVMTLKENISREGFDYNYEKYSRIRSQQIIEGILRKFGFKIITSFYPTTPKGAYRMKQYAIAHSESSLHS